MHRGLWQCAQPDLKFFLYSVTSIKENPFTFNCLYKFFDARKHAQICVFEKLRALVSRSSFIASLWLTTHKDEMAVTTIGELLRRYRKAAGLTQTEIAEKIPCISSTVSRIENGDLQPSPEYVRAFCRIERLALTDAQQRELEAAAAPARRDPQRASPRRHSAQSHDALLRHRQRSIDRRRSAGDTGDDLDHNFIRIALLHHHEQLGFFEPDHAREFADMRDLLAGVENSAIVLLGPPGSGKSTLLRRLQMDFEQDALKSEATSVSLFASLNRYPSEGSDLLGWLSQQWQAEDETLPAFETLAGEGRILLLLDGVNEIPHRSATDYAGKVEQWRAFLQDFSRHRNRAVFTCRSLDYSASLSSEAFPVAHANIKPLNAAQIEAFLKLHLPEHGDRVFQSLQGNESLMGMYATPYHLSLLVKLIRAGGDVPQGRAELFTFIVREALHREVCERKTASLLDPELLSIRDQTQVNTGHWRGYTLPERGLLLPRLTALAFNMQRNRRQGRSGQVSLPLDDALSLIDHARADDVLRAGEHLGLIEEDLNKNCVAFSHQLFQEYFAARKLARQPDPALAFQEWRATQVSPSLEESLTALSPSDPLTPLPSSGWEETAQMAVAMCDLPDDFVSQLAEANLPLAGLCAAMPDAHVSDDAKDNLRQRLTQRTQDAQADLRARIAAGLALGQLGDPRFQRRAGPHGDYLLPPMVSIPAGRYHIGSEDTEDSVLLVKNPAHDVEINAFELGVFAVTNAEFKCFVASGGYENESWWDTPAAKAWRIGAGENLGQIQFFRDERARLRAMSEHDIYELVADSKITISHAEGMLDIRNMNDAEFEVWLEGQCAIEARHTEPRYWADPNYNNPAQPVVGICWHEARAYCNWLSTQSGMRFRLPTEAEWEAAARGFERCLYPFGQHYDARRCNCFEWHVKQTTPVGIFPPWGEGETNKGRDAIYDLAGNTWEWTSSALLDYPYSHAPAREDPFVNAGKRIIRGGSWLDSQHSMLASGRSNHHPAYRDYYVGFRLAASVGEAR